MINFEILTVAFQRQRKRVDFDSENLCFLRLLKKTGLILKMPLALTLDEKEQIKKRS